ncbi:MAG: monovalent cation/H+ antiporter complex subunit F [Opitutales bacterium]
MKGVFFAALELFLLLNIVLGLTRLLQGPTSADRMLAVQLFGTTGVGVLVLMAHRLEMPALRDVAFIFALLATLTIVAYARLAIPANPKVKEGAAE